MSVVQKKKEINASIEVFYSQSRKQEMVLAKENNCLLLINLVRKVLRDNGAYNIRIFTPKQKERIADIIAEFTVMNEEQLDRIERGIKEEGEESIGEISTFISE